MPHVVFTSNLQRYIECPEMMVQGATVRQALDSVFESNRQLRGYVIDEQNRLRTHMAIFVDGKRIIDRECLSDRVGDSSEIYVMQALSGG